MQINFEALFYREPYCSEFEAEVLRCEGPDQEGKFHLVLDDTAFYPEGGGQPGDRGLLSGVKVLDTRYEGNEIVHLTETALKPGEKVHGQIDFARRFELMQQHSGEHMISGIAHKLYGCDNVGFHINEEEMTLDFNRALSAEQIKKIEDLANQAVFQNLPLEISYPDEAELAEIDYRSKKELEGAVRLITVPGVDCCACCGTHLRCSGEVGLIKIVRSENYKGGVRLTALCGERALRDYQRLSEQAQKIAGLYSVKPREFFPEMAQIPLEIERLNGLVDARDRLLTDILTSSDEVQSLFWLDPSFQKKKLKNLAKYAARRLEGTAILLLPREDENVVKSEESPKVDKIKTAAPVENNAKAKTAADLETMAKMKTDGADVEGEKGSAVDSVAKASVSGENQHFTVVLASEKEDLQSLVQNLREVFAFRGGGHGGFYQGELTAEPASLKSFFENALPGLKSLILERR